MDSPLFVLGPAVDANLGATLSSLFEASEGQAVDQARAQPDFQQVLRDGGALLIAEVHVDDVVEVKSMLQTCDPLVVEEHAIKS